MNWWVRQVLFVAPTRPLVEQQAEACHLKMGLPLADSVTITGGTRKDVSALIFVH
jgi:ERCC4-related helicase